MQTNANMGSEATFVPTDCVVLILILLGSQLEWLDQTMHAIRKKNSHQSTELLTPLRQAERQKKGQLE